MAHLTRDGRFLETPQRRLWGRPIPLALDLWLDQRWVQSSVQTVRWGLVRLGWMLCGAGVLLMVGLPFASRLVETALTESCHILQDPALDAVLAMHGLQHGDATAYAEAHRAWLKTQAEGKPPSIPPMRPHDAWRVCEVWRDAGGMQP